MRVEARCCLLLETVLSLRAVQFGLPAVAVPRVQVATFPSFPPPLALWVAAEALHCLRVRRTAEIPAA